MHAGVCVLGWMSDTQTCKGCEISVLQYTVGHTRGQVSRAGMDQILDPVLYSAARPEVASHHPPESSSSRVQASNDPTRGFGTLEPWPAGSPISYRSRADLAMLALCKLTFPLFHRQGTDGQLTRSRCCLTPRSSRALSSPCAHVNTRAGIHEGTHAQCCQWGLALMPAAQSGTRGGGGRGGQPRLWKSSVWATGALSHSLV